MALTDCCGSGGGSHNRPSGRGGATSTRRGPATAAGVLWALAVVCLATAAASPRAQPNAIPSTNVLAFMRRYAYLEGPTATGAAASANGSVVAGNRFGVTHENAPMGRPDSETLYSEDAVVAAIKLVQKFGAIPQTGVLDEATNKLMTARRCGCPDVQRDANGLALGGGHGGRGDLRGRRYKRFVIASDGWNKRHIKYHIVGDSSKIDAETVNEQMVRAFDAWSPYGRLRFSRVHHPDAADITVSFGRGNHGDWFPFDGQGGILAHAFYPYHSSDRGGDIHFDDDEPWAANPNTTELRKGAVDLFLVAVHELGHSLGLGHSPDPKSIMFPYYQTKTDSFALGDDDIRGMQELYIRRHLDEDNETGNNGEGRPTANPRPQRPARPRPPPRPRPTTTTTTTTTTPRPRRPNPPPHRPHPRPTTAPTYEGDVETVDDHKEHDHKHRIPPPQSGHGGHDPGHDHGHGHDHDRGQPGSGGGEEGNKVPDLCSGSYDAVAQIRGELFVFKGEYLWRLRQPREVMQGYPVPVRRMFPDLPEYVKRVDAVYQRDDGHIVIFTGDRYWVYDGSRFVENSPQHIGRYGLPSDMDHIDAVMVWQKNRATYFFRNSHFWRYNSTTSRMDPGYPKPISRSWRGVPDEVDDAMTWTDGKTYFFKGEKFYQIDNKPVNVERDGHAPRFWFGCR